MLRIIPPIKSNTGMAFRSTICLTFLAILFIPTRTSGRDGILQQKAPRAEDVPTFSVRVRVLSASGKPTAGKRFVFHMRSTLMQTDGDSWTQLWKFDRTEASKLFRGRYPVLIPLMINRYLEPVSLELEIHVDETDETRTLRLDLIEVSFTLMSWRDENGKARIGSMAEFNQRYWKPLDGADVPPSQRPRKFPIADRFIGDGTLQSTEDGVRNLARAGFNVIMLPPTPAIRELLAKSGLRTAAAEYAPPGYAFDYSKTITAASIPAWADQQAAPYKKAGYKEGDPALFAMSDEPGWYYPSILKSLMDKPEALMRFREYIKSQGLTPADAGTSDWANVIPIGRSEGASPEAPLTRRRLFYWTMRFLAWDSSRHFAACARALEKTFYPGMPIFTNWNFFAGRLYVPGPAANNPDKKSPDAAMGGHDWSEFAKMGGGTMLWTEDWYGDILASQWSFYAARLRSAAKKNGGQFGGYVVPRLSNVESDGLVKKMMCLAGSGAKAITCYTFGPEYLFPGNCYSEKPQLLRQEAEANRLIGASEDFLWPGRIPALRIAILWPRSSQLWDIRGPTTGTPISDAANYSLNSSTVDYLCEAYNEYCALQHANIPADFVDEDDLDAKGLQPYKLLYVTEPNIPAEGQHAIAQWTREGGVLVTVTGTGARDRYDERCTVLSDATGLHEAPRDRLLLKSTAYVTSVGKGSGVLGEFDAMGARGAISNVSAQIDGRFEDGAPAVVRKMVGKGQVIHFAWLPGVSYANSAAKSRILPTGYSKSLRNWIVYPVKFAAIQPPVTTDQDLVETPVLLSDKGAAITLLNWQPGPIRNLNLTIRLPFVPKSAKSAHLGAISFHKSPDGISISLPLTSADVLTFPR
jgi:hypothetical protein